jgi:hypothetical protein
VVYKFEGGRWKEKGGSGLDRMKGWWQSISAADLDGDGDEDLILGNMGDNFYLRPDSAHPVKLWVNDYSNNVIPEKILTRTVNGKDVPVFLKRELTDQIPVLKKQNLKHQDYAVKAVQDLFTPELIKSSAVREVNYTYSCVAWNEGGGSFTVMPLPPGAQLSTVNATLVSDVNADGKPDIVLGGNMFAFQPQFGRIDASYGLVLLNAGNRKWTAMRVGESGIDVDGEIRSIREVTVGGKRNIMVFRNNAIPVSYQWSK